MSLFTRLVPFLLIAFLATFVLADNYAILLVGGMESMDDAHGKWPDYNMEADIYHIYNMLVDRGYDSDNIYII
ncbi:hypothetical protein ADUPG1_013512, partial [Aduncisulcus paluster]